MGVYRVPIEGDRAVLPYVYTCPTASTSLRDGDKLYVIANPHDLKSTIKQIHLSPEDIKLLREIPSQKKEDLYTYASNAAIFWENQGKSMKVPNTDLDSKVKSASNDSDNDIVLLNLPKRGSGSPQKPDNKPPANNGKIKR